MNFQYTARTLEGSPASGSIEAPSIGHARDTLRRRGLFVHELREGSAPKARPNTGNRARVSPARVSTLLRQMAALLTAGSPIVDALTTLESQVNDHRWKQVLGDIRARVEEGSPLSEAMALHPRCFNVVCRSMVAAGESSGKLPELLDRYARLLRQESRNRRGVLSALMYPFIVLCTGIGMLLGMVIVVLPKFRELFDTLDAPLPLSTDLAMRLSDFLASFWWALLLGGVVVGLGLRASLRTERGRRAVDSCAVNAPRLGDLVRSLESARLARLLGTLLGSYLPILEVLRLTRGATNNCLYREVLERAEDAISKGEPVSTAISHSDLFTPSVREVIRTGEQTGKLGPLLVQIADTLDEDNEAMLRTLTGLLEPVMLILVGLLVAGLALVVYLPLFDVAASAGTH